MTDKKDRDDITSIGDLGEFDHTDENIDELFDAEPEEDAEETEALTELDEAFGGGDQNSEEDSNEDEDDSFKLDPEDNGFGDDEGTSADLTFSDTEIDEINFGEPEEEYEPTSVLEHPTFEKENNDEELEEFEDSEVIVEEIVQDPVLQEKYSNDMPLAQELEEELNRDLAAHVPTSIPMEHIPNFSLKIGGIRSKYDGEDVLRILREFLDYTQDDEKLWQRAIDRGEVLIPRVGEYVAISIAHKLRHIDANFHLGLSEEIFETPVEELQKGPVNHHTLSLNKTYSYDAENTRVSIKNVVTSTTPQLENVEIKDYLGVAMEEKTIDINDYHSNVIELGTVDDKTREFEQFGFKEVYRELTDRLKHHAMNKGANGVINIQFQNIPMPKEEHIYKIICSGTLVWIEKR